MLALAEVNRRFLSAAVRLLHFRLTQASALPDHRLILECYHPIAKISTPYLYCDYLYTEQLGSGDVAEASSQTALPGLVGLQGMYSHFRPVVQEENRRARFRYPTQTQAQSEAGGQSSESQAHPEVELASHDIVLDEGELFSQLCTVTNLVKVGPKRGLFYSHVNISDSVVRIWRDWLATQATRVLRDRSRASTSSEPRDDIILWTNHQTRNVGLRFRVIEREAFPGAPLLVGANEDAPVSYRLQYEELLVRTNQLLLAVEQSEAQEVATSGKAIVIASVD